MNNPEAKFMSPLAAAAGGAQQPKKKQRGGTPSRSTNHRGVPPTSRGRAPQGAAVSTPSSVSSNADDAIARRRAELRRLQQQRTNRSAVRPEVTSTHELLGKANAGAAGAAGAAGPPPTSRNLAAASGPPPTAMNSISNNNNNMPVPTPGGLERVRHSDLFPTAPKPTKTAVPAAAATTNTIGKPPTSGNANGTRPPPPPPVARKLEFSAASRAKSAPPQRPPPPPTTPKPPSKEAPPVMRSTPKLSNRPAPTPVSKLVPPSSTKNSTTKPNATTSFAAESVDHKTTTPMSKPKKLPAQKTPHPVKHPQGDSSLAGAHPPPSTIGTSSSDGNTPPPLVAETPKASTSTTKTMAPPSTSRRDRIRELRQGMDSPPSIKTAPPLSSSQPLTATAGDSSSSSSVATERLEAACKKAEAETKQALEQIKELEEKLQKANSAAAAANASSNGSMDNNNNSSSSSAASTEYLAQMLQVAEDQGDQAALKWARAHISGAATPGLLSPMAGLPGSPVGRMLLGTTSDTTTTNNTSVLKSKRLLLEFSPSPIFSNPDDAALPQVQMERRYLALYKEAATTIPYEYASPTASFIVRRPYGIETTPALFDMVSPMTPTPDYARRAHVSSSATIEIAVTITADNSIMVLFGDAGVRYRTNPNGPFKEIANTLEEESSYIGTVNYIDENAMEQSYSLDEIYQEALLLRERYCATVATTAMAFKERPKEVVVETQVVEAPAGGPPPMTEAAPKPETSEMGVGTAGDIPYPPAEIAVPNNNKSKDKGASGDAATSKKPKQAPPQEAEEEAGASGDVLALFVGMIVQSIFGFIWWILIGLPISTIKTSIIFMTTMFILSMVYLNMMQEHNTHLITSSTSLMGTTSEYYFSNAPGIL